MSFLIDQIRPYTKVLGAILLIGGTSIGGGMLALPLATAPTGFAPSLVLIGIVWIAMTFTAFLWLECNLSIRGNVNIISMSRNTLGPRFEIISWISYLLLLYSLVAAYISGASSILNCSISSLTSKSFSSTPTAIFIALIATLLVVYGINSIDKINRFLILVGSISLIAIFLRMVPCIRSSNLSVVHVAYAPFPLPILTTAFGFHIVIPSLVQYLDRNVKLLRLSLLIGSLIPLIAYILWQITLTGSLSLKGENGLLAILTSNDQLGSLETSLIKLTRSTYLQAFLSLFSMCAILTSLLGVSLSLWDFLKDGLRSLQIKKNKSFLAALVFVPPLFLVVFYPQAFTTFLGYAGIFVSILLGILPIAMCWKGRNRNDWGLQYKAPGGRFTMVIGGLFFLSVIYVHFLHSTSQMHILKLISE